MKYRNITRTALLIALCVVLGYLFLPIPNLEMITAGIFVSGIWMGIRSGLLIGFVAEAIFSTTNPMGFPPPPLLIAQVAAMSLVGLSGGLLRGLFAPTNSAQQREWPLRLLLAITGLAVTLLYDFMTTISFPLAAGFSWQQIRIALAMGIPFMAMHSITNTIIFSLAVPIIINRFPSWRNP
jgi:uncharacterized membrane protein